MLASDPSFLTDQGYFDLLTCLTFSGAQPSLYPFSGFGSSPWRGVRMVHGGQSLALVLRVHGSVVHLLGAHWSTHLTEVVVARSSIVMTNADITTATIASATSRLEPVHIVGIFELGCLLGANAIDAAQIVSPYPILSSAVVLLVRGCSHSVHIVPSHEALTSGCENWLQRLLYHKGCW